MNTDHKTGLIILNWNNYPQTARCLDSVAGTNADPDLPVWVVDNGSEDDSGVRIERHYPRVTVVFTRQNLGFARGVNVGLRAAHARGLDSYLLLNSDMEVTPRFYTSAVQILGKSDDVGIVTGKILLRTPPGRIWHAGGRISLGTVTAYARGFLEKDSGQYETECDTEWASGAMCLIARRTLERVGYLPEEYFFGQEEWDYSRQTLRHGLRIVYDPKFLGIHDAGGSHKDGHPVLRVYNTTRNKFIYAKKYLPTRAYRSFILRYFFYLLSLWPLRAKHGCATWRDFKCRYVAAWYAFFDRNLGSVTLQQLAGAQRKIGVSPSWRETWRVE